MKLLLAVKAYPEAHRFISRNNLWGWLLVPGVVSLAIFVFYVISVWGGTESATEWILDWIGIDPSGWAGSVTQFFFGAIGVLFYLQFFKAITLIFLAPFLSLLADKVDRINSGLDYAFSWKQFIKDIWRGVIISLRNLVIELSLTLLLVVIGWIPLIGQVAAILVFVVQFYFLGFGMMDYTCERRQMNYRTSVNYIWRNKWLAIGNGMVFYLFYLIPVFGWMFAPIYALIAANIAMNKASDLNGPI